MCTVLIIYDIYVFIKRFVECISRQIISMSKVEAGRDRLVNMFHRSIKSLLFLEEHRFRSRFHMMFHSIHSSNTLSFRSGKPNCVLWFSANRV